MSRFMGLLIMISCFFSAQSHAEADIDQLLDHQLRRLHANETVDLKVAYQGKPMLFVNTASHCGFTGQFEGLEALHQRYKDRGLIVAGFPSNSFRQEANDESETAKVCFFNFGVSFDMYAPVSVVGSDAHPIFAELARQSRAPRWNFYKYLIDQNGRVVEVFSSTTSPDSRRIEQAIEALLGS
ncbi:glutathione peroxidase [Nitrincola sp.]|uniref:glutathione peroxidase n=1 Tax=Nitrincola sp. TaxID=1926584 RepID=UPI003A9474CF